jgi:ATP-dependent exoDNAse (exonuclease V) beta subunit
MIQGTATHTLILEPEEFDRQFYNRASKPKELNISQIKEELDQAGIEYKKTAKKLELEQLLYPDGKKVDKRTSLDDKVFKEVFGSADALRSHDITGDWFCPGQAHFRKFNEASLYVKHELGMTLKGRLDRMVVDTTLGAVNIYDLKTTQCAHPKEFAKSVVNFRYDLQAAFYAYLATKCFPGYKVNFYFVALERKSPHGIGVFHASDQLLTEGFRKMDKGLTLWASCNELDYWPGYEPIVHELNLPTWATSSTFELGTEQNEF